MPLQVSSVRDCHAPGAGRPAHGPPVSTRTPSGCSASAVIPGVDVACRPVLTAVCCESTPWAGRVSMAPKAGPSGARQHTLKACTFSAVASVSGTARFRRPCDSLQHIHTGTGVHTHTHTHTGGTEDRRASSTRPTHRTWPPSSQCWPPPLATVRPMPPRPPPCPWARRPQSPPRPQAPRQPPPPRRARPAQSCAAAARPGSYRSRHRGVSMHLTATPEVCAQWRTYARAVSRSFTSRAITRHAASCWYSACDSSCRAYVFPDTHKQTK
jgi:hypothetical protein